MTLEDEIAATTALLRWFESQGISEGDAVPIMGRVIAAIVAHVSEETGQDFDKGLRIVAKAITKFKK